MSREPKVYLVGAGPGDPELLTVKARRLLGEADVVVYDRLVSEDVLALIPPGTARIDVGKQPKNHPYPQREINALLVNLAKSGKRRVVRLKGGDPLIFGRGSEEMLALAAHGIACEVVPGVTAASGCAARLGIPLTHRGLASGVRYVTGHCRDDADLDFDWQGLADPETTLVIYMGKANIDRIAARVMAHGLDPATPVAAVCNGTTAAERYLFANLGNVAEMTESAGFEGPLLFIVGRAVNVAQALHDQPGDTDDWESVRQARVG